MEYNRYFILIAIIGSLSGILFGIFTNDLISDNETYIDIKNNANNSYINIIKEEKKGNKKDKDKGENKNFKDITKEEESENIKNNNIKKEEIENIDKDSTKEENENINKDNKKEEIENIDKDSIKEEIENINKDNKKEENKNINKDNKKEEIENIDKDSIKEEIENINKDNTKEEENEKINNDNNTKEEENENIKEIIKEEDEIIEEPAKQKKTIIAVSYATDNRYIYPTIVSITSLVINAASNTFYNIYILHPPDFKENSKIFLNSVVNKYPDKCSIIYFNMGNKYKNLGLNFRVTTPTYYRLSLHELLPDVNRIIYLDGDTLIFEDLKKLNELDMKGNIFMGFLDSRPNAIKSFGFEKPTVVCAGVLLMDLEALRKYGYTKKINDFINNNKYRLIQQDQTIVNVLFQDKLAPIPPKYGLWAFVKKEDAIAHNNKQWPHLKYDEIDLIEAYEHPGIVHFIWPKPFWRKHTRYYKEWWDLAKLTGFYDDIYNKSPIPNIKWSL